MAKNKQVESLTTTLEAFKFITIYYYFNDFRNLLLFLIILIIFVRLNS